MDEKLHKQPRHELNIADSDSNEEEEDEDEGFEVQVLYVFILTWKDLWIFISLPVNACCKTLSQLFHFASMTL